MRKITLLLSLLLAVTATADTFKPEVSDGSTKTFYKIKIAGYNNSTNYIKANKDNEEVAFNGGLPEGIFTFESAGEENVYYIYSEDYEAYLSANGAKEDYGTNPITYTQDKNDTEKWTLFPHGTAQGQMAIVSYENRNGTPNVDRYGLNVNYNVTGKIVLWRTHDGAGASFFYIEEVDMSIIQNIANELDKCGDKVGYPTTKPENENVNTALATAQKIPNSTNITALQTALENFWTNTDISDIKLPEDGKIYSIRNYIKTVTGDGQQEHYIQNNNGSVAFPTTYTNDNTTRWVCQQKTEGNNRTYASIIGNTTLGWQELSTTAQDFVMKRGNVFGCLRLVTSGNISLAVTNEAHDSGLDFNYSNSDGNIQAQNWSTDFIFKDVTEEEFDKEFIVSLGLGQDREEFDEDKKSYYGTLYLPFAVTVPNNEEDGKVTAYIVRPSADETILEEVEISLGEDNILPAGTPVLLKGEAGESAEDSKAFTFKIAPAKDATATIEGGEDLATNKLQGSFTNVTPPTSGKVYTLAQTNGAGSEVKFFRFIGEQLTANKAYYYIDETQSETSPALATIALSSGGKATGIESTTITTDAAAACYDLSGRQVTKPTSGLYIVGGKKIFVK